MRRIMPAFVSAAPEAIARRRNLPTLVVSSHGARTSMAGKFIELKEAAAQLGITPEQLQEMREAGKIHGYKDGTSWKFKPSELERVAGELSSQIAAVRMIWVFPIPRR